jgi:SAM-dependent methyltransferase
MRAFGKGESGWIVSRVLSDEVMTHRPVTALAQHHGHPMSRTRVPLASSALNPERRNTTNPDRFDFYSRQQIIGGNESDARAIRSHACCASKENLRQFFGLGGSLLSMKRLAACVACGSVEWKVTEIRKQYELASCASCGLKFTVNPDYHAERYQAGYEGTSEEASLPKEYEFVYVGPQLRLEIEGQAYFRPRPRLTRAEKLSLRWLRSNVSRGGTVVDFGCGTGRFLSALKRAQIPAVGVEVSTVTVDLLNRAGLKAIQSITPDFPWPGPDPTAIVFFEVLEHLPEPRTMIEPLRLRFPGTAILGSVPSPIRWPPSGGGPSDSPPHHYLWWTPTALERFFRGLGYSKVQVQAPPPAGYEQMPSCGEFLSRFDYIRRRAPRQNLSASHTANAASPPASSSAKRRVIATGKIWGLWAYHLAIDVLGTPKARRGGRHGRSAASLFFVAEP